MAVEIVVPKWGLSMKEGTILQWLKNEGDPVEEGEEIVEIESDKITNVVEAPASGILARILHPVGSTLPITQVIGIITGPGEALSDDSAMAKAQELDLDALEVTGFPGRINRQQVEQVLAEHATSAKDEPKRRVMPAARRLAKERGLDLSTIRGTGPNSAITKQDVEAVLAAQTSIRPLQRVSFFSEGHRLNGLLYSPEGLTSKDHRTGVVLCVGYTYLKELVMPDIAKVLNAAGYVSLLFDYRGFGESEGPRWRLMPAEQINDVRAALTFLANQPHVDPQRLAVVGLSLGGSHAIASAAIDERVRAAVAIESPANGGRWLRSLRRYYEWQAFQARLAEDRSRRVQTGESTRVDPLEIVLPDPDSRAFLDAVYQEYPQMQCDLPLETADALIEYSPELLIERVTPRPVLLIHGEDDRLVPVAESQQLYAHAEQPKQLEILSGLDHFNWLMPDHAGFQQITGLIVNFLTQNLPSHE